MGQGCARRRTLTRAIEIGIVQSVGECRICWLLNQGRGELPARLCVVCAERRDSERRDAAGPQQPGQSAGSSQAFESAG